MKKVLPQTESVRKQIISTTLPYYPPVSKICPLIVSVWMPIFIWLVLYDHFFFVFITKFFRLAPPSPPRTSAHVFLFWETGPHASEEKVVHYFIPTFSSFLASLSPVLPRSASTQAGPSNQLSQQSALQIWMAMNDNRQGKLSALICHRSCKSVLGPLSFSFYIFISLSICLSLLFLSLLLSLSFQKV